MTIIGSDGPSILLRAIMQQRVGPEFADHLDELLVWLNKGGPEGELTARLKLHGVAQTVALQRALELIDQHLFGINRAPHEVLGLPADASAKTVRLRYRRLIQAFHPDRQPDHQQWLTERTEQLNSAYNALKNKTAPPVTPGPPPGSTPGPSSSRVTTQRVRPAKPRMTPVNIELSSGTTLALRLRSMLGAGRSFEKRFFTALFVLCFGFLGYLYYLNKPPAGRLQASIEPFATAVEETEQQTRVPPSPLSLFAAAKTDASYLTAGTVRAIEAELDSASPQPGFFDLGPVAVSGAPESSARDLEPEPVFIAASQPDELAPALATVAALLPDEPALFQDVVKPGRSDMINTARSGTTPMRHLPAQVPQSESEAQQQPAGQISQSKPASIPKVAREKPVPGNYEVSGVAALWVHGVYIPPPAGRAGSL
ncbi:MAG: J domain-containing protein [Gammaproteobacteria bacterium]